MPRGGDRSAAAKAAGKKMGRPKNEPDVSDPTVGKGFATRVFARLHELKLTAQSDAKIAIKTAEDYALDMLRPQDAESKAMFKLLLAYQLGKPVQPTMQADTRENVPDLDLGRLCMPSSGKPGAAGKPN
jgi:hypothetical protein